MSTLHRAPRIELSAQEARDYRLGEALLALAEGGERSGLAFEISDQIRKALPPGAPDHGGILVPDSIPTSVRAGLDTATATKGQELKFTQPGPLIDVLRVKAVVLRLGARELEGLIGDFAAPRLTQAGTANWSTQNPGSDVAASNVLFNQATMAPKELIATTSFSRQLLAQSQTSVGVDQVVRGDIALSHAVAIDAAALNGSGSSGQPRGIINTSGIGSVAGGTNGAQPSWANITGLELQVANANADTDPSAMAYVTSPTIRNTLRNKDRSGGTTSGWFVMSDGQTINDYPVGVTNGIPQTLTKGTSVGVCHAIVFGLWSELWIGLWGAMELTADPYTLKKQAMIEVASYQLTDITVRHPAAFAAMLDALQ